MLINHDQAFRESKDDPGWTLLICHKIIVLFIGERVWLFTSGGWSVFERSRICLCAL